LFVVFVPWLLVVAVAVTIIDLVDCLYDMFMESIAEESSAAEAETTTIKESSSAAEAPTRIPDEAIV
jgi:hypothetical protein